MATKPKMTREEFIRKYGTTFVADDKGGNAASEVAGKDVGTYYDKYLAPGAKGDLSTTGGYGDNLEAGESYSMPSFGWKYRDSHPDFDAWDNVNPHPESQDLGGLGEFWRQIGRPAAAVAGTYFGGQALNGWLGGSGAAAGATTAPVTGGTLGVTGTELGALGAGGAPMTLAEQMASYGAGGGGVTGGLTTGTVGGFTGAAGGDLVGAAGSGSWLNGAGTFLKDNPTLAKLVGAVAGAASEKDTQTSASQSKDPWSQAQPYLIDNLKTNAAMQEHYRANPFSDEQKTAYQGLMNTIANNTANAAPMTANANSFMQSSRGRMPTMQGLQSGTQAAPIDWSKYANIGRK